MECGAAIHKLPLEKIQPKPTAGHHWSLSTAAFSRLSKTTGSVRFALIPSCSALTCNNSSYNPKLRNSPRDVAGRHPSSNYQTLQGAGNSWQLEEPSYTSIARVQSEQVPPEACHCSRHSLSHTSYTCANCSAAIVRPDHAAWHLLCSLSCQCPTHMDCWGFLMLTHLRWGLGGEPLLRDLPALRHCVLSATFVPDKLLRPASCPSNHFQYSSLKTQSSHRNLIFRVSLPDYGKMLINYRHTLQNFKPSCRSWLLLTTHFLSILWRKLYYHSKSLIMPDGQNLQCRLSQHSVEQS